LKVRNCDSEYGLSLLTWGRLCDLVTPRSAVRVNLFETDCSLIQ
jgi:hypothetical protein